MERSLDGNTWEAVPGTAPVAVTHPDTKAVWDNVDEFDNNGLFLLVQELILMSIQ